MRFILLFFILPYSFFAFATTPTITLSLDKSGNPIVEYAKPSEGNVISFSDTSQDTYRFVRSTLWDVVDGCALQFDNSILKLSDCKRPQFTLRWDGVIRDRRYPPMMKLQNGGALVFTQYLQTNSATGFSNWRVVAPRGGVVTFRGQKSDKELIIPGDTFKDNLQAWIYLGPDKFAKLASVLALADDGIPEAATQMLTKGAPDLIQFYEDALGKRLTAPPVFYLTWNNRDKPGRSFQADVINGGEIRFGLDGAGWATASSNNLQRLQATLAHELAHLWNSGIFQLGTPRPWLHEGNAELLSFAAQLALGQLDKNQAAERVNTAYMGCIAAADGKAWLDLPSRDRGIFPYQCGLAIQFALVAQAQKRDATINATEFWRRLWQEYPRYSEWSVTAFVAKVSGVDAAETLYRLTSDNREPLSVLLTKIIKDAGVESAPPNTLSKQARISLAKNAFADLMRVDCRVTAGYRQHEDHLLIDDVPSCKTLKKGMKIRNLEGIDILQKPIEAFTAAREACNQRKAINIGLLDGEDISMSCNLRTIAPLSADRFLQFTPDDVSRILVGAPRQ
jgi:hypothetical protein